MEWIDVNYMDPDLGCIGKSCLPNVPNGWWVLGACDDKVQSRECPFTLSLIAATSKKPGGVTMFSDTGEAFSYFEKGQSRIAKQAMSMFAGPNIGSLGALFGFNIPTMPQIPMPETPVPDHGREIRYFSSIGDYLDNCAVAYMGGKGDLFFKSEEVLDGADNAASYERKLTKERKADFSAMNARLIFVVNKVIARTVMRTYEFITPDGNKWLTVLGARLSGYDMLTYESGVPIVDTTNIPFGRCALGEALFYDVEWQAIYRFGGCCPIDHKWAEYLPSWCKYFVKTVKFDETQMKRRSNITDQMNKRAHEQHDEDIARLRQLNKEMHESNIRRQERLDWERARSWERKQASDRRIREGWSAAIRGVDQYRGPYGELIEVPVSGPGYRAYYDRLSGTVLHTDRYMGGSWEELPEWKW